MDSQGNVVEIPRALRAMGPSPNFVSAEGFASLNNFSHAHHTANHPMFRKLQCGCNDSLTIHVTSFEGEIPLQFLQNLISSDLSFTETLHRQTMVTQSYAALMTGKVPPLGLDDIDGSILPIQYKPLQKKHAHSEYCRVNYHFHTASNSESRMRFFTDLDQIIQRHSVQPKSKNRAAPSRLQRERRSTNLADGTSSQFLPDSEEQEQRDMEALLYVIPCPFCYKLSSEQEGFHKTFLWNIINKLESEIILTEMPLFIIVDHLDSDFDWRSSHTKETCIKIIGAKMTKDNFTKTPRGIICPLFSAPIEEPYPGFEDKLIDFYQLDTQNNQVFMDISLQWGFNAELSLTWIQETMLGGPILLLDT